MFIDDVLHAESEVELELLNDTEKLLRDKLVLKIYKSKTKVV